MSCFCSESVKLAMKLHPRRSAWVRPSIDTFGIFQIAYRVAWLKPMKILSLSEAIREVLVGEEAKKIGLRFVTWTQIMAPFRQLELMLGGNDLWFRVWKFLHWLSKTRLLYIIDEWQCRDECWLNNLDWVTGLVLFERLFRLLSRRCLQLGGADQDARLVERRSPCSNSGMTQNWNEGTGFLRISMAFRLVFFSNKDIVFICICCQSLEFSKYLKIFGAMRFHCH